MSRMTDSATSEKTPGASGTRRPLGRIVRIHELVNRGKYPNCRDIARELEVNRKTIQRDVNFMRDELDLPIVYDRTRHGYAYSKPVNEFPMLTTSAEDLVGLILARNALGPLKGTPLESSLRSGFRRLQSSISDRVSIPWSEIDEAFAKKSHGVTEHDAFLFDRLARGVLECRELKFEYSKLSDPKPESRRVQPYHLIEIDGGWYLIGYDLKREARRTFAVQRMKSVHLTEVRFVRSKDFQLEDHFGGSFGVWSSDSEKGEAFLVRIRFTGFAARIVAERRWHPSQEIEHVLEDGSEIVLTLQLTALEDIARWVLGFGPLAEVMAPELLRERVSIQLEEAAAQYRR